MPHNDELVVPYLQTFLPRARVLALVGGEDLPAATQGAALFADISGFTPLAEALNRSTGDPQQGAEALTGLINDVFEALIPVVYGFGGDVLGFAGDAMLCWFPEGAPEVALTCALALQREMGAFAEVTTPGGGTQPLAIKLGMAMGEARRFRVGAPEHGYFEILTGAPLLRAAEAEHHGARGEIIAAPEIVKAVEAAGWGESRGGFRPLVDLDEEARATPVAWGPLPEVPLEALRPYFPPDLYTWLSGSQRHLLAELRPVVSAFVRFEGLDYDHDPDVGEKLDAYVRMLQRTASHFGGMLARLDYGDKGNMAHVIFGAPVAHEDNEARAVGWILEAQAAVRELGFITAQTIGATRGQVYAGVLGSTLRRGYTLMGDEVNASARLMQACQPGQALVSQRIIKAAQKHYLFHRFPGFQVKGKFEPLPVGTPVAPLPPLRQLIPEGPLVGREAELARLQAEMEALSERGGVIRVEGAAGVGKSRLVSELVQQALARGVRTLVGSAQSVGQKSTYLAWRDIFRILFGLQSGWPTQQQALQIESQLRLLNPGWAMRAPLLGDLLGIPIPDNPTTGAMNAQLRQQALFALLEDLLARMAEQIPLLIVLEDCQWLDEASTALAQALAVGLSEARVLLLCLHRPPEPDHPILPRLDAASHYLHLLLEELPPAAVQELVRTHLGGELPRNILAMIEERAQGNPFFAGELAETLRETAHLRFEEGRWVLVGGVGLPELPDSIQGVVLARLDRLNEGAKLALKVASVVGRRFAVDVVEEIHPEAVNPDDLLAHLERLERRDILRQEIPPPDAVERFRSNAFQEVAYGTLLYDQRRALHRAIARWYEAACEGAEDLQPYYPLLAYHYRYSEEPERERRYARLAGAQAARQYANHEALDFLGRALALTPEEDLPGRYEILLLREQVHDILGEREAQRQDLEALQTLVEKLDDDARRAAVTLRQANYAEELGDFAKAVDHAQTAIDMARRVSPAIKETEAEADVEGKDQVSTLPTAVRRLPSIVQKGEPQELALPECRAKWESLTEGHLRWGRILRKQGEFDVARSLLEQTLALAREHDLYRIEADALLNLGVVSAQQGRPDEARAFFERTLSLCRAHDDQFTAHKPLNNLGLLAWMQNDLTRARDYYEQSLDICRAVGYREGEAMLHNNLGLIAIDRGDYIDSMANCERALRISRQLNNRWLEALALNNLGLAARVLGRYTRSQEYFEQSLRLNRELHNRVQEIRCLSNVGLLYHQQGDHTAAREAAAQAVNGARELGERSLEGDALTYWGHALAALGEGEEARDAYRQALALRSELGEPARAELSRAGLIEVALAEGNLDVALEESAATLEFLKTNTLDGAEEPFRVYWAVIRTLQAVGDPRASQLLAQAHERLQEQAAALPDGATRRTFLEEIATHRAIRAAYEELAPPVEAEAETAPVRSHALQRDLDGAKAPDYKPVPLKMGQVVVDTEVREGSAGPSPDGEEEPPEVVVTVILAPEVQRRGEGEGQLQVETSVQQKRNQQGERVIKVTVEISGKSPCCNDDDYNVQTCER